jgi:hypothetical protein
MIYDDELEMREKYPIAADLIEEVVNIICKAYPLKFYGPSHDVAGHILTEHFIEEEKKEGS